MDKQLLPDSQVTPKLFETLCTNIQSAVAHRFNQNIDKGNLREFAARVLGFENYNRAAPVLKAEKQFTGYPLDNFSQRRRQRRQQERLEVDRIVSELGQERVQAIRLLVETLSTIKDGYKRIQFVNALRLGEEESKVFFSEINRDRRKIDRKESI